MAVKEPLQELDNLLRTNFAEALTSTHISNIACRTFISTWKKPTHGDGADQWSMKYLPLFYVISCQNCDGKLSLKLITHHGKIIEELNEDDEHLDDKSKVDFFAKLLEIKPCQGINLVGNELLKLDLRSFSFLYLIEQLEQNVIIRSRQCTFALKESTICEACEMLSTENNIQQADIECFDEKDMVFDDNEVLSPEFYPDDDIKTMPPDVFETDLGLEPAKGEYLFDTENDPDALEAKDLKQDMPFVENEPNQIATGKPSKVRFDKVRKSFKCYICNHQTKKKKEMIRHKRIAHGIKEFKCKVCAFEGKGRQDLKTHISMDHPDVKRLSCPQCTLKCNLPSQLRTHIRNVHDKVKPFQVDTIGV